VTVDKELFADTLPTYLTRFVGRDQEIATVLSMLHPGRLVTICGVGGAGKTRLGIEVAKRNRYHAGAFGDYEVYWVPLAAVADPAEVPTAVADRAGHPHRHAGQPCAGGCGGTRARPGRAGKAAVADGNQLQLIVPLDQRTRQRRAPARSSTR